MIKWGYILLSVVMLFASCDTTTDVEPEFVVDRDPQQVTLMYLAGLDLKNKGYYSTNIARAKSAIAKGDMGEYGAFYYFLPSSTTDAVLYELSYDGQGNCISREVAAYDDIASVSKAGFMRVVADVKSDVGADVMAQAEMNLIWGGHGTGWILSSQSGTQSMVSVMAAIDDGAASVGEYIPTRYLGLNPSDSASEGVIDIDDLQQAISESGTHFGYILFDSCLMSSIEVLYRLRECCDYFVVSPAEVPALGFPYATVISELYENNGKSYDLQGVCQAYYNYYTYSCVTVAMCVSAELEGLATAMSRLSLSTLDSSQLSDVQRYDALTSGVFFDLMDYVIAAGDSEDEDFAAFEAQFNATFPESCRFYTSRVISNLGQSYSTAYVDINTCSGVSTSQPSTNTTYNTGWNDEPWAVAISARQ